MQNEYFKNVNSIDLDKVLNIKENRKPNHLGLYRLNCLIIGKTGSGKTTTLLKLLLSDAIDDFGCIIFIIPIESLNSGFYESLIKMPENKLGNKLLMFIIIGEDDLPSIQTLNEISKKVKSPIAIVLDDFINAFKKDDWLLFRRYVTQLSRVQNGASLFALTQNWLQFPTPYRKNFNCFVLFVNSLTLLQFRDIVKSYYDYGNFTKEQLNTLFNIFKQDAHSPLWLINTPTEVTSMLYDGVYINAEELLAK